jgi:hypothetical protein
LRREVKAKAKAQVYDCTHEGGLPAGLIALLLLSGELQARSGLDCQK